ncbi:MAG: zinc ribbon domain-containing protein [Infirmifilum sp.]|uniref:zinc ribbon domain-containing protein n=1 Tax=Infirmifilum uzonense TaxID=1550241 RepID=UPI003C73BBB1
MAGTHCLPPCSWCGNQSKETHIHRGLYKCPECKLTINTDINACLNITHETGYSPPTPVKVEAFLPTHQRVTPLTEKKKTRYGNQARNNNS